MLNFIKKIFSIFSIFLIFNLTFVTSAQANPEFVATKSVGTAATNDGHKTQDVVFNSNGTRMFVLNNKSSPLNNDEDKVNQYNIDIADAFDLTEAGSIQAFERVNNRDHAPRSLAFSDDGETMFVVGDAGNDINVYTLQTGFDVSTATFVNINNNGTGFSVANKDTSPQGIAFSDDGKKMFVVGDAGNDVNVYTLSLIHI